MDKRMPAITKLEDMVREKRKKDKEIDPVQLDLEVEEGIGGQPVALQSISEEYEADLPPGDADQTYSLGLEDLSETGSVASGNEPIIEDRNFLYPDDRPPPLTEYESFEQLNSLHASVEPSARTTEAVIPPAETSNTAPEEVPESRKQLNLSSDEKILWNKVQSLIAEPLFLRTPPLLAHLLQRSKTLVDGYKLRAFRPTEETYTECKMMLEALGIPCIEARGAFEAEGLAAALVRRGLAHYVASEDTVCFMTLHGDPDSQ